MKTLGTVFLSFLSLLSFGNSDFVRRHGEIVEFEVNVRRALGMPTPFVDVYLAQTAAGAADGSSCANALVYTFFNNSSNWGAGLNQIAPDTKVHTCGTITVSANSNVFTWQGSGSTGHPITLVFETGSSLQGPYFPGTSGGVATASAIGAVVINGFNNWVIDGGSNGSIQATASGTAFGAPHPSYGVYIKNASNYEVKNLTIANMYVHQGILTGNTAAEVGTTATITCPGVTNCGFAVGGIVRIDSCNVAGYNTPGSGAGFTVTAIGGNTLSYTAASGLGAATGCIVSDEQGGNALGMVIYGTSTGAVTNGRIHNDTFHDSVYHMDILWGASLAISGLEVDHNIFYHFNIAVNGGDSASNSSLTGYSWHDNEAYDAVNWDDFLDQFHHNDTHLFVSNSTSSIISPAIYNNYMHGDLGSHETASVYLEPTGGTITNPSCFNNVMNNGGAAGHQASYGSMSCEGTNATVVNNGYTNNANGQGSVNGCMENGSFSTSTRWQNNYCVNFNVGLALANATVFPTTLSNNDYFGTNAGIAQLHNSPYTAYNMTNWHTLSGGDATPPTITVDPQVATSAPFKPNSGPSPLVNAGINLFSVCNGQPIPGLGALCNDINGVARPTSGNWDIGPAQFSSGGGGGAPVAGFSPSSYNFGNQIVGTPSGAQTIVLTNSGTATMTISSISFTGTNAGDFSQTNSCGSSLAVSASCNISVTFTPGAAGSRSASLSVASNTATTPDTAAMSGNGVLAGLPCGMSGGTFGGGAVLNCH